MVTMKYSVEKYYSRSIEGRFFLSRVDVSVKIMIQINNVNQILYRFWDDDQGLRYTTLTKILSNRQKMCDELLLIN